MKKILTICFSVFSCIALFGQSAPNFFQVVEYSQVFLPENAETVTAPADYQLMALDFNGMVNHLRSAPAEGTSGASNGSVQIQVPLADGTVETFRVWESTPMAPELAERYPMIKGFSGVSITNSSHLVKMGYSPAGFFSFVTTDDGGSFISNLSYDQTQYYYCHGSDPTLFEGLDLTDSFLKKVNIETGETIESKNIEEVQVSFRGGGDGALVELREYRFALACTGEYGNSHGGTVPSVLGTLVQATMILNTPLQRDVGIRLVLIPDNDQLVFINAADDPYENSNNGGALLGQNEDVLNDIVGLSSFDVGHVFTGNCSDVGGVVSGRVCAGGKARGVTCHSNGNVAMVTITIAAHEMAHQYDVGHTWNRCGGGSTDQFNSQSAFEPGSGATLTSYKGLCGNNDNLSGAHIPYYNVGSVEEFWIYSQGPEGNFCPEITTTSNHSPVVTLDYPEDLHIPISTPFQLEGVATDEDGDDLTYSWEQHNLGPSVLLGQPVGTSPSFRVFPPKNVPFRIFPRIFTIVNNNNDKEEVLPTYTRDMDFRLLVRDNNVEEGAGGVTWQDVHFRAVQAAGPFLVMSPNAGGESWEVGDFVEVTWDVANTTAMPVNCQTVNIRLSLDGGFTYPITLLSASQNDGTAFVTVPDEVTDQARIRVEAADNIFFDISNNNFSIVPPTEAGFALEASSEGGLVCLPEAYTATFQTTSLLGFSEEISFSVDGLPNGAIASFSTDAINPGDATNLTIDMSGVTGSDAGDYTVTVTAESNGVPTAVRTLELQVVSNDFSALQLLEPAGASGIGTLPAFEWSALPNALSYNFQISTDAAFANIVAEGTSLDLSSYELPVQLESNTVYYWHVSVNNECGTGEWSFPGAFKTLGQVCTEISKTENLEISDIGTPTVSSTINISAGGEINDVNIANVKGQFDSFGDLEILLEGPAGTVLLMPDAICFANAPFNFGIDDESPSDIPCAPDNGVRYKPANPLSFFDGSDSQGNWTLSMKVTDSFGTQGGIFENWDLEVCGAFEFSDPFLVTNEMLGVPPNETNLIFVNTLEVADDDNVAQDLTFTIVDDVASGYISVGGTQLGVGGQFTMTDIYSSQVTYTNTDGEALTDNFSFIVEDPDGGFLGTPVYSIEIDEGAIIGAAGDVLDADELLVFPNPTSSILNIVFKNEVRGEAKAMLFNAQGQLLKTAKWDATGGSFQMDVSELAAGFHLLQVSTEHGNFTKKVMVD